MLRPRPRSIASIAVPVSAAMVLGATIWLGAATQPAHAHGPKPHGGAKGKLRFDKAPGQGGESTGEAGGKQAAEPPGILSHGKPAMRLDTKVMYQRLDPARDTAIEMASVNNQSKPAYTISDCTEGERAMVCCSYDDASKGGDCGIFKMVCEEWGWTVEGEPKAAKCSAP